MSVFERNFEHWVERIMEEDGWPDHLIPRKKQPYSVAIGCFMAYVDSLREKIKVLENKTESPREADFGDEQQ